MRFVKDTHIKKEQIISTTKHLLFKIIIATSDHTATVIYEKNTGKRAAFFFYYIQSFKKWNYFVPTDSHINGMSCN